jgi:hypothetical protein
VPERRKAASPSVNGKWQGQIRKAPISHAMPLFSACSCVTGTMQPGRSCDATGASFSNLIGLNMSRILAFEGRTEMVLSVDLIHPHLPFFSLAKCEFRCGERTDSA